MRRGQKIVTLLFVAMVASARDARGVDGDVTELASAQDTAVLERRLQAVYAKVSPTVVVVDNRTNGDFKVGYVGVVVTAEGHVLMPAPFSGQPPSEPLAIGFSDGRRAAAKALGWSREWGVALAQLAGPGPWPHVPLDGATAVRAGEPIATLTFSLNEAQVLRQPLVDLEWADRAAREVWFMRPDGIRYQWQMRGTVAFDLDGRLLGIENATFPNHGTVFTHVGQVRALWADLVAGKNLDRERLTGPADQGKAVGDGAARPTDVSKEGEQKAIAASVRILYKPGAPNSYVSGTVFTEDGLVATCGHHFALPGSKVTVALPDGRDVAGEVVGHGWPVDISVVRITDPGPFTFAEVGDSTRVQVGDPCLLVGYGPVGRDERQPRVRPTVVVEPETDAWSYLLPTDPKAETVGGDSGGGLFDADGRLIAFAPFGKSFPGAPNEHVRVEVLRAQAELLHATFEQSAASPLAGAAAELDGSCPRSSIVEVLDGDQAVALGTVVSADGSILTTSSGLPAAPICRLADGKLLPGVVRKLVQAQGLAVLKVDAAGLAAVRWSDKPAPTAGAIVGLAGPKPVRGTVAHAVIAFPGERGRLGVGFGDDAQSLKVAELTDESMLPTDPVFGFGAQPLQVGDVVLSLDGRPTPTAEDLRRLLDPTESPVAVAGDQVLVEVDRGGARTEVVLRLRSPDLWPLEGQTPRNSGFAQAFGVAVVPGPTLFGGPVFDRSGQAVGVAVGARQEGWVLAVPAAVARAVSAN